MSFNVWREHPSHVAWRKRCHLVASLLRYHRPNFIGAQEFLLPMIRELEPLLPEFAWIGAGRDDGGEAGEFTPIFYRGDDFDLLERATFWLAPDSAKPAKAWGAAHPRTVTWGRFRRRSDRRTLFFFNTHFDHFSARARQESARLLLRQVRAIAAENPAIVTGDLNCRETSAAYAILTGKREQTLQNGGMALHDALLLGEMPPIGPRKTWLGVSPARIGSARLDYIFVNAGLKVIQHAVLADHWDGRYASDHLPVVADVELTTALV